MRKILDLDVVPVYTKKVKVSFKMNLERSNYFEKTQTGVKRPKQRPGHRSPGRKGGKTMKKRVWIILALCVLLVSTLVLTAFADGGTVVYVKDGGTGDGSSAVNAMGDLFAAIDKLDNGGTVVVCGDLSISPAANTVYTWPANSGKVTVTGKYKGVDYTPVIKTSSGKVTVNCTSEILFQHLTINHAGGPSTEFFAGPSLTFGDGMVFQHEGSEIVYYKDGYICVRMGNTNSACADSYFEICSGTISYIQGGNNKYDVTNSQVVVRSGVKITDFIQCGGTKKNVTRSNVTIEGADVNALYLGGYGSSAVTGAVTVNAVNTNINYVYGQRSGSGVIVGTESGTISDDLNVTLDNTTVGAMDLSMLSVTDQQNLTLKNQTNLTLNNSLSGWDSLTLENATVLVDTAYAGPAAVTADEDSLLIVDDATAALPTVTENRVAKESEAVVYLDPTGETAGSVTTLSDAYAKLADKGGIIVLCNDMTLTYTTVNNDWPVSAGPVTVTGKYGTIGSEKSAVLTLDNKAGKRALVQFRSTTKFSDLHLDETNSSDNSTNRAVELWSSASLTFGEGMVCTCDGGSQILKTATNGRIAVRMGDYNEAEADGSFTMYSGMLSFIQGGNNITAAGNVDIYVGQNAVIVDMIQCGGTKKPVASANVTVDGAVVDEIYINGHSAAATMGTVNLTIRNAAVSKINYHRTTDAAATTTTANLVLDHAAVGSLCGKDSRIIAGSLTLKNYSDLTLNSSLSGWDTVKLENAVVYISTKYEGPTGETAATGDADSLIYVDHTAYPEALPTIGGIAVAYIDEASTEPSDTGSTENTQPDIVEPVGTLTEVYLDDTAADGGAGTKESPVNTMEKAFAALKSGEAGTIYIVGEYNNSTGAGTYVFPSHDAKVTITGTDSSAKIHFDAEGKTAVQFVSPVELNNLTWIYRHSAGNMDIYAGQELVIGEGMTFTCTAHGTMASNCIAIRGGYIKADYNISGNNNTKITMLSGTVSYIMGGNGVADVGDVEICFGGTAEVIARLQTAGANGNDVGNVTMNITGGTISDLVLIGHSSEKYTECQVKGDSVINITGGTITKIITSRSGYEKHLGNLTMTVGGTAAIGSIELNAQLMTAEKSQKLIFDNCTGVSVGSGFGDGWDSITLEDNATVSMSGAYTACADTQLNLEDGSILYLNANINETEPAYNKTGTAQTGKVVLRVMHSLTYVKAKEPGELIGGYEAHYRCTACDKYFTDADGINETTLEALTIPATGSMEYHNYVEGSNYVMTDLMNISGGRQGSAISGDTLLVCDNKGYCSMYDLKSGDLIADFPLGSYNGGTLSGDAARDEGTAAGNWTNHANQMMFGAAKFDESDPLPLLYVTTGNSGAHDGTGAYISKCAIERIRYSESKGWYAETVQIIEFNDVACIPVETDANGNVINPSKNMNNNGTSDTLLNMYNPETGKFMYIDDPDTAVDESRWQKVGWGWAASFVDSDPTEQTAGKFYLFSARYRTTEAYQTNNRAVYGNGDPEWDYYDEGVNAYIITEFNMPALPASESDPAYGGIVTLHTSDIIGQFETEYEIGVTQGGTMYQGRIYYSFGWNGEATNLYKRNGIQVFDIAQEKIVAKLALYTHKTWNYEPECTSIWNGELVLGMNGGGHSFYIFDYVALDAQTVEPTCTEDGYSHIDCSLCGVELSRTAAENSVLGHSLTKVEAKAATCTEDGNVEYYHCTSCGKNYADAEGKTELADVTVKAGHSLAKVEAREATKTENGNKEHYLCSVCGKLYADAEGKTELTKDAVLIPATGASVDTGDDFEAWPWIVLLILSGAGVVILVILGKKSSKK